MTLSALGVVAVYAGSGSAGPFSLTDAGANPILFEQNSEIIVTRYDVGDANAPVFLVNLTDFSVTGAGSATPGAVTLTVPLAVGKILTIQRSTALTQTLDLVFGGDLSLETLERQLDKSMRIMQELREEASRSLVFFPKDLPANFRTRIVPAPVAGKKLAWNATADRLVNADSPAILSGAGAPAPALGLDGDFYFDLTNSRLYGPKAGGVWGAGISLIGGIGPQGIQGIPGPTGSGTGDVLGPVVSADGDVPLWNGVNSKTLKTAGWAPERVGVQRGVNAQAGANYTTVLADAGQTVEMTNAGANTLTIPLNATVAYVVGTYINFAQLGTGQTTITPTGGVTLRNRGGLKTAGQYAVGTLYKRGTDEWVVGGDLTP